MTAIVPREDESDPGPPPLCCWPWLRPARCWRQAPLASRYLTARLFAAGCGSSSGPFETDGKRNDRLQTSGLPIARQMTRCVNPTLELKAEFAPLKAGGCSTKDLRKTDDGYVFQEVVRTALRRSRPRSMR